MYLHTNFSKNVFGWLKNIRLADKFYKFGWDSAKKNSGGGAAYGKKNWHGGSAGV